MDLAIDEMSVEERFSHAIHNSTGPQKTTLLCWLNSWGRGAKSRLVPYWEGPPGCGKTDMIRQTAKLVGAVLIEVILSRMDSGGTVVGFHMPVDGELVFIPHNRILGAIKDLDPNTPVVVFLDELSCAQADVLVAIQSLVTSDEVEGIPIGRNVLFVAAGNRPGDKTSANPLPMALWGGRLMQIPITIDKENRDSWYKWASEPDDDYPQKVHPKLVGALMQADQISGGETSPLHYDVAFVEGHTPPAWRSPGPRPTHRSWARLGELMYTSEDINVTVTPEQCAGVVSEEGWDLVSQYFFFDWVLPTLESIITDPHDAVAPRFDEVAKAYMISSFLVGSLARRFKDEDWLNPDQAQNVLTYLRRLQPEFSAITITRLIEVNPDITTADGFMELKRELDPIS